jgi:hypothetical protein
MTQEDHRSPLSGEIVRPYEGDGRSDPRNIAKRVEGHQRHTVAATEQLMANSALRDDPVTDAADTDPDRLFHSEQRSANFAIVYEKPEHRVIVYLKAQGLSNSEVANKTGFTKAWVGQICRQPWFRLRLVQELKEAGLNQVDKVLRGAALDSVFTIIDIRDDPTAPKAVRRQAADSLLDRFLGKPTQRIESEERSTSSAEISAVDEQLREIDKQLEQPSPAAVTS